jgi:hypothetical protein
MFARFPLPVIHWPSGPNLYIRLAGVHRPWEPNLYIQLGNDKRGAWERGPQAFPDFEIGDEDSLKSGNELHRIAPQLRMRGVSVNLVRTNKGRLITLTTAGVPIIPPTCATASPIKSSSEQPGSDYSADMRKSNHSKAVSP